MRRQQSLVLLAILLAFASAWPAAGQIRVELQSSRVQDSNFRIGGTYGFSVSHDTPDLYRVYATTGMARGKWQPSPDDTIIDFFWAHNDQCSGLMDPRTWNGLCLEGVGHYWKNIACGASPCEWNGRWNAAPGANNISAWATRSLWPRQDTWGVLGFERILHKDMVNAALPTPPTSGNEGTCQPHNPGAYASGAANPKAVEVRYSDGSSRWFMAFNKLIHAEQPAPIYGETYSSRHSEDKWRIAWATSSDGENWQIDDQILFRNANEATSCHGGLLVTSMMIDGGYFYMTVSDVPTRNVHLLRAPINTVTRDPGYGGWSIATGPNVYGNWVWAPVTVGSALNLPALGAAVAFTAPGAGSGGPIRQTAITRVFTSATPYSSSRYVALSSDVTTSGAWRVNVYSSTSMGKPFQYESTMTLPVEHEGQWGFELAFTHWPDNLPASPRSVAGQLDLWFAEKLPNPEYPHLDPINTVSRRTVKVSGGIFGN